MSQEEEDGETDELCPVTRIRRILTKVPNVEDVAPFNSRKYSISIVCTDVLVC